MYNRFGAGLLFFIISAFILNGENVYAADVSKSVPKKVAPPRQEVNTGQVHATQFPINQLQNDIRGVRAAVQEYRSIHSSIGQNFSAKRKINNNQIQQLDIKAQDLLTKAKYFAKHWAQSREKAKIVSVSEENRLKLVNMKRELKSLIQSVSGLVFESVPVAQSTPIADCLKKINESAACGTGCCDEKACVDCCVTSQPKDKIGMCSANCLFKASICILSGIADRQADNVSTFTHP